MLYQHCPYSCKTRAPRVHASVAWMRALSEGLGHSLLGHPDAMLLVGSDGVAPCDDPKYVPPDEVKPD